MYSRRNRGVTVRTETVNPCRGIDQFHPFSTTLPELDQLLDRHKVLAGAKMTHQCSHPLATIVIGNRGYNCAPLGLLSGVLQGIPKFLFWNINRCFHTSIMMNI